MNIMTMAVVVVNRILAGAFLLGLALGAFAAPAAKVEFSSGEVTAQSADGRVRSLLKGAAVESGETVQTNIGRAQLRFTDGGFVSLYDRTTFRIDEYRWEGKGDGSERSFFSLLKGGLRTITGRVAKANRKAYQMTTTVATIGIRGTEYTMQLNGSLKGAVAQGEIEVCNAGGCLAVAAGQGYLVTDQNTKPALARNQTMLPPPPPSSNALNTAAVTQSAGELLGATNDALFDTLGNTSGALIGAVQDLSGALLGGTALGQPVQGLAGGTPSGPIGTAVGTTQGVVSGVGAALGGVTGSPAGGLPINLLGF
jgi:hypothetical protein